MTNIVMVTKKNNDQTNSVLLQVDFCRSIYFLLPAVLSVKLTAVTLKRYFFSILLAISFGSTVNKNQEGEKCQNLSVVVVSL